MSNRCFLLLLVSISIGIGWVGGAWFQGRSIGKAVTLLNNIHLSDSRARAVNAYKKEVPEIAIWEFEHLLAAYTNNTAEASTSKSARLELFLANARLARLFVEVGNSNQALKAFHAATNYYNSDHSNARIVSMSQLLERIDQFDEFVRVKRMHPATNATNK